MSSASKADWSLRVSPQQEARWQQWYEQDQDNQWAWQQVENLRNQLGGV
ncbi:DUF4880 domain-containing protein, partial [Escherichia coli]